jgi:sirohydrochlorin cobaltochelatase
VLEPHTRSESHYPDAALVLIAHGTSRQAAVLSAAAAHAEALARRRLFARVEPAFWKQAPTVTQVIAHLDEPRVFLVPLLTGEGFFAEETIPTALGFGPLGGRDQGRIRQFGDQWRYYCRTVGTHPRVTDLVRTVAGDIVARHPFPRPSLPAETALVVVGHGTPRNRSSRRSVEDHVERLRRSGEYAEVHAAFLEEAPGVEEIYQITRRPEVVVVPLFIGDGEHAAFDIPIRLGAVETDVVARLAAGLGPWRNPTERHGKRLWCAAPIGRHSQIADIILDRVREAAFSNFPPA